MMLSDYDYDFIYSRSPRFCVDLIIKNQIGKILFIKRDQEPYKDYWHAPGGRVLFRESVYDAIARILKKETGIVGYTIEKQINGFCEFLTEQQYGSDRHSVSVFFEINVFIDDDRFMTSIPENFIPEQKDFLNSNGYY